ncbi:c-di-GMP-binding flagellar brake protein YcgR [Paucibacter oligotrophus]|uniref:C-di-GMP-binding flagellar brake protein YcgR n=1 Tax=Roseateles oligotrophus TaxID=1769250 RepID=A0A840LBT4_9BURK|nr:flagellar brake protein [Roseateles oligotrophus]MBB4843559.1 c-di-GMP-binding flagellar brake protein YcgR [Roseateles oligotrophus]
MSRFNSPFQPASPEASDPEASGDFRIQGSAEVLVLLQALQEQQIPITLSTPAGLSMQSCLSAVDGQFGALGFDVHPDDPLLPDLLSAEEVTAVAYLDQIKLQFELEGLLLLSSQALARGAVLRSPMPQRLYRFQRRQSFRVRPSSRTPQLRLPHPHESGQELQLRILDLSLGGLALLWPAGLEAPEAGSDIASARIELDRETRFEAGLRVQNLRPDAEGGLLLGLNFARIDNEAERLLQRYIDQVQKLGRLLRKKLSP